MRRQFSKMIFKKTFTLILFFTFLLLNWYITITLYENIRTLAVVFFLSPLNVELKFHNFFNIYYVIRNEVMYLCWWKDIDPVFSIKNYFRITFCLDLMSNVKIRVCGGRFIWFLLLFISFTLVMRFINFNTHCIMYILASDFFLTKTISTYLKLEIRVREFLVFKYAFIVSFEKKSDDYLYLYIRNLENSRLKPVFWYSISFCICVCI